MKRLEAGISMAVALALLLAPLPDAVRAVRAMPLDRTDGAATSLARVTAREGAREGAGRCGEAGGRVLAVEVTGDPLIETLRRVRPATVAEENVFVPRATASAEMSAARARLAPLAIDASAPRVTGTTVGWIGVSFPVHGAVDGPASRYALWFDASSGTTVAEADFVRRADGVHARVVLRGDTLIDSVLDADGPPAGGDFWDCFVWCAGEALSHDVYVILRAACSRACVPVPNVWCELCMITTSVLEAGMISGCTHTCMKRR